MPGDARKRVIALDQFEVGAANPRYPDTDKRLAGFRRLWQRTQAQLMVF
jgi:hypothetical protein